MAINKRKILETAQKHLQKGALDKALKEYQKLLKADPKDANIRLKVGDVHLKQGKTDEAINAYLRVAENFMQDGFDAKAVALFKQITKIDAKRFDIYVPLAELYQRMGLQSDAMKALQTAADASYREGEKDQALDLLRKMAALDPSNTTSRVKVADLLHQEGRTQEALTEYDEVVGELDRQGAEEERVKILERILELAPERSDARVAVGRASLHERSWAKAEAMGRSLIEGSPDESDGYEILGEALDGAGKAEESAETYRKLADLYRERGDEDKARDIMQRFGVAASLAGDDAPVLETGDDLGFDPGASSSDLGLEAPEFTDPGFAKDGGLELGAPIDGLGEDDPPPPEEASATGLPPLDEAPSEGLEAPEGDPEQLLAEANVYLRYGKHDRAIESLKAIVAKEPGHLEGLSKLGEALAQVGRQDEAVDALSRACELAQGGDDAAGFESLCGRLASLDAAAAERFQAAAPQPAPDVAPDIEIDEGLDLDDEIDAEVSEPTAPAASEDVEFDIDVGGDDTPADDEIALEDAADIDVDLGDEEIDLEADSPAGDSSEDDGFDLEADDEVADEIDAAAEAPVDTEEPESGSSTTPAQVQEDLEEAEFYFQQGMMDEAREIYDRILAVAPNHPQAQLRMGEIDATPSDGAAPADAVEPEAEAAAPELEPAADLDVEVDGGPEIDVSFDLDEDADGEDEEVAEDATSEDDASLDLDAAGEDEVAFDVEATPTEEPVAAPAEAPLLTDSDEPVLDDTEEPVLDQTDEPVLDDSDEPVLDESEQPVLQDSEEPLLADAEEPQAPEVEAPAEESLEAAPARQAEITEPDFGASSSDAAAGDFDLAAELSDAFDDADEELGSSGSGLAGTTEEEGFEQVFAAFKEGVKSELGEGDFEAHYDLGIAYKEMGLHDDAIAEFERAMGDEGRQLACLHMMGLCALDLGRAADATSHLEQALGLPEIPEEQQLGLRFDLGRAYAASGDVERARAAFEAVRDVEPGFCDVEDHLAALDAPDAAAPEAAEEAFESFDDLIGGANEDDEPEEADAAEEYESFDDIMDAEEEPEDAEPEAEPAPEPVAAEPEPAPKTRGKKPGRRKKISFV